MADVKSYLLYHIHQVGVIQIWFPAWAATTCVVKTNV